MSASADGKLLAYGAGTVAVVRSLSSPGCALAYCEHGARVKVVKISPSGKYVASGDASGKVRVWPLLGGGAESGALKYELPSIGGEVEDLAWDGESKRLLAVGGGQAKAKFFAWDTGSSLGEVVPHTKKNITCDLKAARPLRAVLGGEDFQLSFYEGGPPYKYARTLKEHSNFVNCVRYAPDGSRFLSVSSDKAGVVYSGETAAAQGRLDAAGGHAGGVYSAAWAPDSSRAATAGGDKTVRLWDLRAEAAAAAAGGKFPCTAVFTLGKAVEDMQMSVVWPSPELLVSLSLDGTLNYLTPTAAAAAGEPPAQRISGHAAAAQYIDFDASTGEIVTGDLAGRVCVWRAVDEARTTYVARALTGDVPTKKVAGVAAARGEVAVIAWDDKLRVGEAAGGALGAALPLPAQPKGLALPAAAAGLRFVVTAGALLAFRAGAAAPAATLPLAYGATCLDCTPDGARLAVGGKDRRIHLYRFAGDAFAADGETGEFAGELSVVALHPGGETVAGGDAVREVRLYATAAGCAGLRTDAWVFHTTRVTGLRWSPSGRALASVSTDRRICVWDPAAKEPRLVQDLAAPSPFAGCAWADDTTLWTVAIDGVGRRHALPL